MLNSRQVLKFHQAIPGAKFRSIFIFLLISFAIVLSAQSDKRSELEKKRVKLLGEITFTTKLIEETKKNKSASLNLYSQLKDRYKKRQELTKTINSELIGINREIRHFEKEIELRQVTIKKMEDNYAKILRQSYKLKLLGNNWAFIWSSDNLNQAFARWRYLRQFKDFQQKESERLQREREDLENQRLKLGVAQKEKQRILNQEMQQNKLIEEELKELDQVLAELNSNEKQLKKDLDHHKKAQAKLNAEIEAIIKAEIERERKRKEAEEKAAREKEIAAGKKPATPGAAKKDEIPETPKSKALSQNFEANKGKLPWPVSKGLISKQFGNQPHPTLPGLIVNSNGIDIQTEANAPVFSIFDGEVIAVKFIAGFRNMVLIRHGQYYTVYSNLEDVTVQTGQTVARHQKIGIGARNELSGDYEIHFELWKNKSLLNPTDWILRR